MNNIGFVSALALAGMVVGTGASAASITYAGTTSFDGGSYTLHVTTDGATGALAWSDLTAIDLSVTYGGETGAATLGGAGFGYQYNGGLSATPTSLKFDFGQADALFNVGSSVSGATICLGGEDYGCGSNTAPGEGLSPDGVIGVSRQASTLTTLATVVPEPDAWTLMLIGVAGLGGLMRARRKSRTAPAYLRVQAPSSGR